LLKSISAGSAIGDITSLEDDTSVQEIRQAYIDLTKEVDTS
jgi:hypothetical protein